ncbi:MAG: AsmA-like C-terminal domain-containing protein [Nitrospira sp.]|nr:AsmA-like C-terminal domain-containing protein [Nitrospira sp.]
MSRLRLFLVMVLALAVGVGTFLLFSNTLIGEDYLKEFVLQQLEESLGRKIEVHRAKFVIFPRIRVELTQVAIHDPNSDEVVFSAKRIDLVLRLLPLLRKQVVGKRLLVEDPVLTIHRNEAGHWNILDNTNQAATDQRTLDMMTRVFMIRQATVVNGSITVIDEGRPGGTRTLKLERVEGGMMIRPERAMADVHLSVAQTGQDGLSAVSLVGQIKRVERSDALTAEEPAAPAEPPPAATPTSVFQFEGQVDAANVVLRDVADFFGPRPVPEQLDGMVNVQGQVRIMPGLAGYDAVLSSMTARLNQLTLTGKANLAGLLTAQPTFAVTFNSSLVTLKELLNIIPAQWIHPQLPAVLAERQIDGKVQVVNATLTGSATSGPQLSVTGEFRVQEGQALLGEEHVLTKDLAGVIVVETGRVRAASFTGRYGAIQITEGKATVSFLEAGPWLELEITGSMAATDLVQLLAKTVKAEGFVHLLAGLRDVEGTALPTFRLVGPLNEPGGVTFAGGEIAARYISLTHPSLPERLTALQGKFVLADGGTRFEQVTGHLGDTILQVQGGLSGGPASVFQEFVVRANGDAGHIMRFVPAKVIPVGMFEGLLSAAVQLSGATTAPHVRGNVVLTESKVVVPNAIEKPIGAPAILEFEGNLTRANIATVTRVELVLPSVRIPVKGAIQIGDKFSIDATLATGELSLSGLPEWIAKGGFEAGNVEVSLDVKGKDTDWKTWKTTGWMAVTNGLVLVKGAGHIDDLYARVKLVRNGAEVKRLSFKVQDSDLALEATVRNWPAKPVITGKIESNQLDLDLVIPKGERSPMRELLETLASSSQVTMTASAARAHYRHLKFGGLTARITIQDGVLDIDRIGGDSTNGQVAGRVVVQLPAKAPAETEVSLRATGVSVEDLLRLTHADIQGVSGQVRLNGTIRGHGRNPHGVYPSLNGKTEVLLENGRILKSKERAIWKILSILNLPAVLQGKVDLDKEGLPYNRISATVAIQNGSFQTENLVVDSPILKITAAGNYDLPTDQLDMVVAVSPFGSYATFLKTIPLFGRIFAGERKGMTTAIFSIKGAVEDPEVTYLPMKSFTTGLSGLAQLAVDVLKNTLTLPMDLMTPNEEKPAAPELEFVPEGARTTP